MTDRAANLSRRSFVAMGAAAASSFACGPAWAIQTDSEKTSRKSLFDGKTLDGWIEVENNATAVSTGSIADPEAFMARLAHGPNPVSEFLRGQLDSSLAMDTAKDATALAATLKQINQILAGPLIYTPDRFRGVTLRTETASLLKQSHRGYSLARLNKLLLEDAFPAEINKSLAPGWIVKDGVMASTGAGRGVIYTTQDYSSYRLIYCVRHVSGHPDHQAGVLFFCRRPEPDGMPLDALGGIQFQLPMGSYWDYRPGNNNSGSQFLTPSPRAHLIVMPGARSNFWSTQRKEQRDWQWPSHREAKPSSLLTSAIALPAEPGRSRCRCITPASSMSTRTFRSKSIPIRMSCSLQGKVPGFSSSIRAILTTLSCMTVSHPNEYTEAL